MGVASAYHITIVKLRCQLPIYRLAAELYNNGLSVREAAVSEIHRSKISLHRAKKGYDYPSVRSTFIQRLGKD